jgi:serine/threonine-protein kinase
MTAIENNKKPVIQVETVPNLVGQSYEEMKSKYEALGVSIKVSKYEENKDVEAGYIISQNLEAESKLEGTVIEVVVSKGVKKVEMIGAVGRDYTVAKYELEALGFKVEVKYIVSDKIAKDIVMTQSIKEKDQVVVGTEVLLEVSEGDSKVRVIMPSVIGNTEETAKSTLQKKNLKVSISYVNDTSKSDGVVVTQSVKENAEVVEGTIVELTINRLEKTKTVTIKLSEYTEGITDESISVKVKAQVEGVTNIIHNGTHTKTEIGFNDFTVDVNGFSSAKLTILVNDVEVKQLTIAF